MRAIALFTLIWLCLLGATNCSPTQTQASFHPVDNPETLSAWGVFDVSRGALELSPGVVPYDLNAPLFTDYAHKLRTIWVPPGNATARLNIGETPDFPIGTVISKTFYYPRQSQTAAVVLERADPASRLNPLLGELDRVRLIETRLLVKRAAGWEPVSYVWNNDQSDAVLTRIGDAQALTLARQNGDLVDFTYIVPDINQCAGCHAPNNTTRRIEPLGVRARHLNKPYEHGGAEVNQLTFLAEAGFLELPSSDVIVPANADWSDASAPIDDRARSYLDINCSHCHNPAGPADTSGLDLTRQAAHGPALGRCKLPIAAGSGTGGRAYSIVPGEPDQSILLYRMETTKPGAMMPELGRTLHHAEGAALIRDWIAEMDGTCAS